MVTGGQMAPGVGLMATLETNACSGAIGPQASTALCNSLRNPPCVASVCDGGPSDGGACVTDADCPPHSYTASVPDVMGSVGGDLIDSRIAAYEAAQGNRTITIYGNAAVNSAPLVFLQFTGGTGASAEYEFHWQSASREVLIEFAGHLSVGADNATGSGIGYGAGQGASGISGGPYHITLGSLDGASTGSMDNQIKGADIVPPFCDAPDCTSDDGIACTIDSCDEVTRSCLHEPDDSLCADDGNPCTVVVCDEAIGCVAEPNPGASGDDGDGDGVADVCDMCPGVDDAVFAPECQGAIPTVSEWGLLILALLLLVAGKVYFGRRSAGFEPC